MRKILIALAPVALLVAAPASVNAAEGTVTGAAGGAITGAIIGGPLGAAVGGVIGAVVGTTLEAPPPPVISYVAAQPVAPIYLQGTVAVGAVLPANVVLYPVPPSVYVGPNAAVYAYANINGQQVIVDPSTRVIVSIVG
jgi:hypothetical protein